MIQDPTVNQHQHMIFITKQIKSSSKFRNQIEILQSHNYS